MRLDRYVERMGASSAGTAARRVCYVSRARGWIDPQDPHRSTSEVNLFAVALGARVWTLDTAWMSVFRTNVPREFAHAFRRAMTRTPLTDDDVRRLTEVARALKIDLQVRD